MIQILSHIVEFRNGESGLHVLHVHAITEQILTALRKKTDAYSLSPKQVSLICNASALHDIGKISIASEILNKPGRLTPEEFDIMKTHTIEGAKMLEDIPMHDNEPLIKTAYEICRWHHERYDGRGYPDGLKGDEIPIAAQVVALADVYDALTSKRVYKPAFTSEKAVEMILNGECGSFNPLLLECLKEIADVLKNELTVISLGNSTDKEIHKSVARTLKTGGSDVSNRTIRLLEHERMKNKILSSLTHDIIFEYSASPEMIVLSEWGADYLGMPVTITDPKENDFGKRLFNPKDFKTLLTALKNTTPDNPSISEKFMLDINGNKTWCKIVANSMWSDTESPEYEGAIGKIVDINDETEELLNLELKANLDSKTGLLNNDAARQHINNALAHSQGKQFALVMFDLDNFKQANDVYGHLFGDEVLEHIAGILKRNIRSSDIAARMGGDEFIVFLDYKGTVEPQIKRIFSRLSGEYKKFPIKISMGVACADKTVTDYDELFAMADKAMYAVKKGGKDAYRYYDESMADITTDRNS